LITVLLAFIESSMQEDLYLYNTSEILSMQIQFNKKDADEAFDAAAWLV
jgi:hypothetical protein